MLGIELCVETIALLGKKSMWPMHSYYSDVLAAGLHCSKVVGRPICHANYGQHSCR